MVNFISQQSECITVGFKLFNYWFVLQVFQTPEPLSSHLQPPTTGQAELPQAAGQALLLPTPVNTQSSAQAASPTLGVPTATAVTTQVNLT